MRDFEGKVAVVTGAASGIGRALVGRFAQAGMRVVLADVEREALAMAEHELASAGADVLAVQTDVSSREAVEALAEQVLDRFGKVHILCSNAGVSGGGGGAGIWDATPNDWAWVMGVNLMGVIHGMQVLVPIMLDQDEEGHIVNTSSVLGLATGGGSVYGVSKHAVTRVTEGLYYDLQAANSKLRCSVLCPGMIATQIVSAERNRPAALRNEVDEAVRADQEARRAEGQQRFLADGMAPEEVGEIVFEAIQEERFYILTHPEGIKERVRMRMEDIIGELNPSPVPVGLEWATQRAEGRS